MLTAGPDGKKRCFGNKVGQKFYADYHDNEWGIPQHDDQKLFEMLILEGAQAGLSWETVLKKRDGYRQAFHQFNIEKVAHMSDAELADLQVNPNIIRNRLKIASTRKNAQVVLQLQQSFNSFDHYLWQFVDDKPIINHWHEFDQVPVKTEQSDLLSKDLKRRGMSFVGSTIMYAFMQATGMVNDHLVDCHCYQHNR